ncbi:MAG: hypothetical protein ACLVHS_11325 [Blautia wexlerae]
MTDAVKLLISKYEDANKEYQTQLLNAIKIPLMVYSGRIIQNYPLGLGIRAIIKTNQLIFEAVSKSGSDSLYEYSCAVTPQVRQTGNRLSGLAGTAYASLSHVMFCPSHKPLASRYHVRHQCL